MIAVSRSRTGTRTAGLMIAGLLLVPGISVQPAESLVFETASSVDVDVSLGHAAPGETFEVVVRTSPGARQEVMRVIDDAGGVIVADLPFVDGFATTIDSGLLDLLAARDDVIAVTANHEAVFQGSSAAAQGGDDFFDETIGAAALHEAGIDGSGVGIAVLDSGVAHVPTIDGRVIGGIDLSGENNGLDGVGHGTFIAGVAAGDGTSSPNGDFEGVAPGATIIPVKVGDENGVSLLAVLQGLQWVHHNADAAGIDVLNMSFGTRSAQSHSVDPLNYAVQRLWADGIVVVVAAGNLGDDGAMSITKPADDPFVITVGSSDSFGTIDRSDDTIPSFSSQGPTRADGINKPDIVAPGRSLVGPIAPGSNVDAMTEAHIADGWVRASGTSFSSAVVSGAVALLVQAHPDWTPDQIKGAVVDSAAPGPVGDRNVDGHGALDILAAQQVLDPSNPNAGLTMGTGTGAYEATRGEQAKESQKLDKKPREGVTVTVPIRACVERVCATLKTEVQVGASSDGVFELPRYIADFGASSWNDTQWYGNQWYGNQWYGNQWYGNQWYGNQWYGNQWYGNQWYGNQWYGNQWYSQEWN
ncbi:MAG: serine protease AprX [Glaciecola sp.]|jgi:serine protease AprX